MTTAPALTGRHRRPAAPTEENWRSYAACRREDPELFFPLGTSGPALEQIEKAKAVCYRCPAMNLCGQWALETRQESGVWGGLSEEDRFAIRGRTRSRRLVNGLTHTENILRNRLGELQELEASGLEDLRIARVLGTNVQTLKRVRRQLAEQTVKTA